MSFRLRRVLSWILAAVLLAGGSLLLLWQAARKPDESLERIRKRGSIRIGYAVEAPYAFLKPGGTITGESPEVARMVVDKLGGMDIQWRQAEFGTLLDGLEAGRYDVIATGMFITPERQNRAAFSDPTFQVWEGMLVRKGNPKNLHSYEGIVRTAEVRVAVLPGSSEQSWLREAGLPGARMVLVPDALAGAVAVESGEADALVLSSPTVRWLAARDKTGLLEEAQGFVQPSGLRNNGPARGGFAFRRGDRALRQAWNEALKDIIGSTRHRELVREFGFTEEELPAKAPSARKGASP